MPEPHSCEVCRPMRDRLAASRAERQGSLRTEAYERLLFMMRTTMCEGADPELPPPYRPGGSLREELLADRYTPKCPECQPVADLVVSTLIEARMARAAAQEGRIDGLDPERQSDRNIRAALLQELVGASEQLLADCEARACQGTDLEQAAAALLQAVDDGSPTPVPVDRGPHRVAGSKSRDVSPAVIGGAAVGALLIAIVIGWALIGGEGSSTGAAPASTSTSTNGALSGSNDDDTISEAEAGIEDIEAESQAAADFVVSDAMSALGAAAASFGVDGGEARGCIGTGLSDRNTSDAEYRAMMNPDVSTWPAGLAEAKAQILEDCVPLEPYYLAWFGSFDFQDDACVRVMTDHVLANWSWLRFLEMGILDDVLRPLLDAEFAAFVTAGYGEKGCFAAG